MKPSTRLAVVLLAAFTGLHACAATFTVTTLTPDGPGSLGQAILDANAAPGADLIHFNLPGVGAQTITLSTGLPTITETVTIDATTQPGYAGTPLVALNGNLRRDITGLTLTATGCTVRGLAIINCGTSSGTKPMWGLVIAGGGQHHIEGCYIGLDLDGVTARRNRDGGILVSNSVDNVIGGTTATARNVISGNSDPGVVIAGPGASNNVVAGNFIGLNAAGSALVNNSIAGVLIQEGAAGNRIGGTEAGARNVICGSSSVVLECGAGTSGNVIQGNFIGLRADGTALGASPGSGHGIFLEDSTGNLVGGTATGAGNVISGIQFGVVVTGAGASNNIVQGNLIGTDPTGKAAIPNHLGVYVGSGATENLVGGPEAGARNVISGNVTGGVSLNQGSRNRVQGNFVGTDVTGLAALGNGKAGVDADGITVSGSTSPASDNLIGGPTAAERNVVSGNLGPGIIVVGPTAQRTRIQGNYIGLAADGTTPLGNQEDGILVLGATDTWIGEPPAAATAAAHGPLPATPRPTTSALGNLVCFNTEAGISIELTFGSVGAPSVGTKIIGNSLFGNQQVGIRELVGALISRNSILPPVGAGTDWQAIDWKGDGIANPNSPDNAVNAPVLSSATYDPVARQLQVKGELLVPPVAGLEVQIEIFTNPVENTPRTATAPDARDVVRHNDPSQTDVPGLDTFAGSKRLVTDGFAKLQLDFTIPIEGFAAKDAKGVAIVWLSNGIEETSPGGPLIAVSNGQDCQPTDIRLDLPAFFRDGIPFGLVPGQISGGTKPYRSIEILGTLPPGVTSTSDLSSGSFALQGDLTLITSGIYPFKIRVVDDKRCATTRDFTVEVCGLLLSSDESFPLIGHVNEIDSISLEIDILASGVTLEASSDPEGLAFSLPADIGVGVHKVHATPSRTGEFTLLLKATKGACTDSRSFPVRTVVCPLISLRLSNLGTHIGEIVPGGMLVIPYGFIAPSSIQAIGGRPNYFLS